ncbi:alanine racemase [Parafrigoribacterium mesophilum]|uniref:alanine racemase n=1 Tax=Parafrigoribacterium mesophilum TaxID=433646 RepID=UPI0031FD9A5A
MVLELTRSSHTPWQNPSDYWPALQTATAELEPPFGVLSLPALAHNAYSMLQRASGTTIRVASKSVRVRGVIDAVLALPGFRGVLAFTLAEALWLARDFDHREGIPDVVVGYPTTDRRSLATLAADPALASRVTLMVDSLDQLDIVDAVTAPGARERIRVCLELDASWNSRFLGHVGTWRSPVHSVAEAAALAQQIAARPGFTLVGLMAYEGQIAGVLDRPAGHALRGATMRWMQRKSVRELAGRRAAAVAAVRQIADLEFVNGGGTGSLESTSAEPAVTEIAAGSGLFGPHLFDGYSRFRPAPAAAFALGVVRKPTPDMATLLGGGWVASGSPAPDRLPQPVWPQHLSLIPREGAGEVQTPVRGRGARALRVGDRVWFRHTKAGELSEHLAQFAVIDGNRIVDTLPTYRGEGRVFL